MYHILSHLEALGILDEKIDTLDLKVMQLQNSLWFSVSVS